MGKSAAWGALAGFGHAAGQVGSELIRADMADKAWREREELQRQRLAEAETLQERRLAASNVRAGTGKPGMGALDVMNNPALMAMAGGADRGVVDDALAMANGKPPGEEVQLDPSRFNNPDRQADAGPAHKQFVPKYTPGQGAEVRDAGRRALYAAMGVANPGQADDLEKSRNTAQITDLANEYTDTGSPQSARGALVTGGKTPMSADGTDQVTGVATKGSEAEAKRAEGFAKAGQHAAEAAGAGKVVKAEIARIDSLRKDLDSQFTDLRKREEAAAKDLGSDAAATAATLKTERASLTERRKALDAQFDALNSAKAAPAKGGALDQPAKADTAAPPVTLLKEGVNTTFKNGGGTWTLRNGKPVRLR